MLFRLGLGYLAGEIKVVVYAAFMYVLLPMPYLLFGSPRDGQEYSLLGGSDGYASG